MSSSKLTPEEEKTLQKELPAVLEKHGANNKSKAEYVKSISEYVIGSTNPKFFSMQPRVKDNSKSEPYKAAYLIIFNFLDEFKFNLTKEVMLKEMEQNKVQKPPLPSIPSGYSTTDPSEVFSFETVSEIAVNNNFEENVDEFVSNYLHGEPAPQSPKPAAKPLKQSPGNSPGAFLTQPSAQHVENKPAGNSKEEDDEIEIIEDFNDDYEKEDNDQNKSEGKGSKPDDDDEIIDINDIVDSEGEEEGENKNENHEDDIEDEFIEDVDDNDEENNNVDPNGHKNESDAQNSMSISINSDNFEMDFDDD